MAIHDSERNISQSGPLPLPSSSPMSIETCVGSFDIVSNLWDWSIVLVDISVRLYGGCGPTKPCKQLLVITGTTQAEPRSHKVLQPEGNI